MPLSRSCRPPSVVAQPVGSMTAATNSSKRALRHRPRVADHAGGEHHFYVLELLFGTSKTKKTGSADLAFVLNSNSVDARRGGCRPGWPGRRLRWRSFRRRRLRSRRPSAPRRRCPRRARGSEGRCREGAEEARQRRRCARIPHLALLDPDRPYPGPRGQSIGTYTDRRPNARRPSPSLVISVRLVPPSNCWRVPG